MTTDIKTPERETAEYTQRNAAQEEREMTTATTQTNRINGIFLGLIMAVLLPLSISHAAITWTDGDIGNSNWSDADNWSGALTDLTRVFDDTAVGTSNMDVSPSLSITKLTYANTAGTNILDLNSNGLSISSGLDAGYETLTSTAVIQNGSIDLDGTLRLGYSADTSTAQDTNGSVTMNNVGVTSTGVISHTYVGYSFGSGVTSLPDYAVGTLDMSGSNNGTYTQVGGSFEIGGTRLGALTQPQPNSGIVRFGDNWDIDLGTSSTPIQYFRLGYGGNAQVTAGTGGSFDAYISTFEFGTSGDATMDFSGIDNGTMTFAGSGFIGDGEGTAGNTAVMNLGSDWTMNFNTGIFGFGYNGASTTVNAPNLTVQGALTRFYVGTSPAGSGVGGQVALTVGSLGTGFTIDQLWVGRSHVAADGTLTLPAGDFAITGAARIADSNQGTGTVTLNGTNMPLTAAATSLLIGANGRMNVNVGDLSCGPEIAYDSRYGVSIGSTTTGGGGLMITFTENPTDPEGKGFELGSVLDYDDIFYGFKWAGDRTDTVNSRELGYLVNNNYVSWDDLALTGGFAGAVDMFYDLDSNATYIGFYVSQVPEPASLTLLGLAGLLVLRRRRCRRVMA